MNKNQKYLALAGVALMGAAIVPTLNTLYGAGEATSPTATTKIETSNLQIGIQPGIEATWLKKYERLAPGDKVITFVELVNKDESPIGKVNISTQSTGKLLEGSYPLQANLETCSIQWDAKGECQGAHSNLGNAISTNITFERKIEKGEKYYLKIVSNMPYGADNSYQDVVGSTVYKVEAVQDPSDNVVPVPKEG